jgi:hypothetical protein
MFLSFLKAVLKGLQQVTCKGYSACDVCESNVPISTSNDCACSIALKVTWDPWPSKMNICLFVRNIPLGFDLLKKKKNSLKRNAFIHAFDCITAQVFDLQT